MGGGIEKAVVADGSHATRQDVAEISPNKLYAFEGLHFGRIAVGAIFPAETHMAVADRYNSRVVDGGAADLSVEVFYHTFTTAEGLEIHARVFLPAFFHHGHRLMSGTSGTVSITVL